MKKINLKVRFNKQNKAFIWRFVIAVTVPVLTYFGLQASDLTTWQAVGDLLLKAISNPYVLGFTVVNALNVVPDPTTKGLADSDQALTYEEPSQAPLEADPEDGTELKNSLEHQPVAGQAVIPDKLDKEIEDDN